MNMIILLTSLAALADVIGGLYPLQTRFKGISTRYALAFASGTVISAAFFELLPEANIESNWALTVSARSLSELVAEMRCISSRVAA